MQSNSYEEGGHKTAQNEKGLLLKNIIKELHFIKNLCVFPKKNSEAKKSSHFSSVGYKSVFSVRMQV